MVDSRWFLMKKKIKIILVLSPLIYLFDQITKWIITKTIPMGQKFVVLENFFDIVHTRNKGAAFGMLSQWNSDYRDLLFYSLACVAFVFLVYFLRQIVKERDLWGVPVSLVIGGAIGNISDRIIRGSVVDFLSFHWHDHEVYWNIFGYPVNFVLIWPAFNVADSAITVGVIWLMILMIIKQRREIKIQN